MKAILCGAALLGLCASLAQAEALDDIKQQAQSVCMMDVMTLCGSSIPDETSIVACMRSRRRQLSTPCRKVFEAGLRTARHRQQSMR